MKPIKLVQFEDPGHSWVKVSRELLIDLSIQNEISGYSYQCGKFVYLEEDSDFSKFHDAMTLMGRTYTLVNKHTNNTSAIRNYASYSAEHIPCLSHNLCFNLYGYQYQVIDPISRTIRSISTSKVYKLKKSQLNFIRPVQNN